MVWGYGPGRSKRANGTKVRAARVVFDQARRIALPR
jgi:hypothetical protein